MRYNSKVSTVWLYAMSSLERSAVAAAHSAPQSAVVTSVFCAELHLIPPIAASVVKVDKQATEYAINCGVHWEDGSSGYCGDTWNSTMILTTGPSTMAMLGMNEVFTRGFDCKIQDSTSALCDFYLDGDENALERGHFPYVIPDKEFPDEKFEDYIIPLTITAGFEKLAAHQIASASTTPTDTVIVKSSTIATTPATQTGSSSSPANTSPVQAPGGKSWSSPIGVNLMLVLAGLLPPLSLNVV